MFKAEIIGNLGADAEIREANGSKFVAMRVAHTEKRTDDQGVKHEKTTWIDVTLNDPESKIVPFLKQGVKIFVRGSMSLRVYSSPKERKMLAGATISAYEIELVGGNPDAVPRQLIVPQDGSIVDVAKYYQANIDTKAWKSGDQAELIDKQGRSYQVVKGGWVAPMPTVDQQSEDQTESAQ